MSRPLALTLGEPAGIGPDITLAVWQRRNELKLPPFYVIADPQGLERRAQAARPHGADRDGRAGGCAARHSRRRCRSSSSSCRPTAEPGVPDATSAPAAIASIDRAIADVIGGIASAIVTNPIAKSVLYESGFAEPGHTEYLAKRSFELTGDPAWPVMMLWSPELAVVPVTIHLPFKDVPERLTRDLIVETGRIVAHDLTRRFGIARPRLAVAGLNPHAGEDGTMGEEDSTIVQPAVERLRRRRHRRARAAAGRHDVPRAARATYDVALCMYHDQALIPIKTLAFDHAVNVDARPAVRAHLARSRHRVRHRRHRQGQSVEPDRGAAACGAARAEGRDAADPGGRGHVDERPPDDLPPLREVIARHGLAAKKSLGQNFLLDLNLTGRIARAAGPLEGVTVVEIGPGPGGLTRALLAEARARVIAIERDERAIAALGEIAQRYPGRLDVIAGDALTVDLSRMRRTARRASSPTCPTTSRPPLLVSWLAAEPWPPWYDRLMLMFQREVAERIVAPPGGKTLRTALGAGGLAHARRKSCSTSHPSRLRAAAEGDVVGGASWCRAPTPLACDRATLERVTAAAFGQRRKMLRQSLKSLGVDPLPLLAAAGIEPTARAEEIPVEGFVALAPCACQDARHEIA